MLIPPCVISNHQKFSCMQVLCLNISLFALQPRKTSNPYSENITYRTSAIIIRSCFETALNYKPPILDLKIVEFPCLVHKLSVTLTALQ